MNLDLPSNDTAPSRSGEQLAGKVVIVTGAGSGIGAAAVARFAAAGAYVLACGRKPDRLRQVVASIGAAVTAVQCDVTEPEEVAGSVATAVERYGRLDAAFNCAGVFGRFGPLHEDDQANFDDVVAVNLYGLWSCLRHQIPAIVAAGGGTVVNCASVAAHLGHAKSPLYSATKHAVIGLSKSAALQYAADGVRINVVSPGSTDTEMLRSIYPSSETLDARARRAPLRRLATPEEVADAAVWLASPLSSYVTGQTLVVDGGVTAGSV
ncbi:MAG TPA: glucose 1-dehydrogenase [Actinocrinis sp.]|nr:glucose 1-dehydrogenase [Actinocrinis sp.]